LSEYTAQVRFICESYAGLQESVGADDVNTIVALAAPKIFMNFPIWDEGYRLTLETKILKHFYLREIAHETVGLWRLRLDTYMNELMPVYNKMYAAVSQEFNPLFDVDITRTHDGTSTDSTNSSGNSVNKYSETPQGSIQNVLDGKYLTTAQANDATSNSNGNSTAQYVERITGKQGTDSYSKLLREYIDKLVNVDMRLMAELEPLFFCLLD
jgi:hypothetical protein